MSNITKKSKIYSYDVIFKPLKEGGYSVCFPEIPEICTFGTTLKDAREMAKDALRCYIESVQKELRELSRKKYADSRMERLTIRV